MKNPLKTKKHKFRNFCLYFATYIAVTFCMAFLVVNIAKRTFSNNAPEPAVVEETTLSKVIGKLMTLEDASLGISLSLNSDDLKINFSGDINLKLQPGFSGADLDIDGLLELNGSPKDIRLTYLNEDLYISLDGVNYKIETASLVQSLGGVLALAGVEMIDTANLMSSFDMSMISGLEEQITEVETEEGYVLSLALSENISIDIIIDKEFNVKNITVAETQIGDFKLNAGVEFKSQNTGINIEVDEENYVDITAVAKTLEAGLNTLSYDKFQINGNISGLDFKVNIDRSNGFDLQATTIVNNNDLKLTYFDEVLYLDYSAFKLKTSLVKEGMGLAGQIIKENCGELEVPEFGISDPNEIFDIIKEITIDDVIVNENETVIKVCDRTIYITIENNIITSLSFELEGINVKLNIAVEDENIVVDGEYIAIEDLEILVEPIKNLVNKKAFSGKVNFDFGFINLSGDLKVDLNNDLRVEFSTAIGEIPVEIKIANKNVYLDVYGVKYMVSFDTLISLINDINKEINNGSGAVEDSVVDNVWSGNVLKMLDYSDAGLTLNYENYYLQFVLNNDNFKQIGFKSDKFDFSIDMVVGCPIFEEIDESEYNVFDYTYEEIKTLISNVLSKQYFFDGLLNIKGEEIVFDVKLDFVNGLKAELNANYKNFTLNIKIQENTYFVCINGIKVKGNFKDFESMKADIVKIISTFVKDDVFESSPIEGIVPEKVELKKLTIKNHTLDLVVNNINLKVALKDLNISDIYLGVGTDVSLNLERKNFEEYSPLTEEEKSTYKADVKQIIDVAEKTTAVLEKDYINAVVKLKTSDLNLKVELQYIKNEVVYFKTNIKDVEVWGYLKDNTIYLNVFDICFEINLEDIDIERLAEVFGLSTKQTIDLEKILGMIASNFNSEFIKEFYTNEYSLGVNVGGAKITVYAFEKLLNSVFVESEDFDLSISLKYPNYNNIKLNNNRIIKLNNFTNLVVALVNTFKNGSLSGNVGLKLNSETINIAYSIGFKNGLEAKISTVFKGLSIDAYLLNNSICLDFAGEKIKVGINELPELIAWTKDKFSALGESTDTLLEPYTVLGAQSVVQNKANSELPFSFDFIKALIINNDTIEIALSNGMYLKANYSDHVESLYIKNETIEASVEVESLAQWTPEVKEEDFEEYDAKKLIENILCKKYYYNGKLNIKGEEIKFDIKLDITEKLNAELNANYKDFDLNLRIENNQYFITLNGIKLKGQFDDISEIIESVKEILDTFDVEEIFDNTNKEEIIPDDISLDNIDVIDGAFNISLGDIKIVVKIKDYNIEKLSVNIDDISLDLERKEFEEYLPLTETEINTYKADVKEVVDVVEKATAILEKDFINAVVNIKTTDLNLSLQVEYIKNEVVYFNTSIEGIDIWGYLKDNTLYLNALDICFEINLNDVDVEKLAEVFGIDLPQAEQVKDIISTISSKINSDFIKDIYTVENCLGVLIENISIVLNSDDNNITSLALTMDDIEVLISLGYPETNEIELNNNKVIKLNNFTNLVSAFYYTFKNLTLSGNLDVNFKFGEEINTVNLEYGIKYDGELKVYLSTTFKGLNVNVYIVNNIIYVDVLGVKVKVGFNEINDLIGWINETFNLEISLENDSELNLSDLSLDFINEAVVYENKVEATIFDSIFITANYTDVFNSIYFDSGDINATIYCTSFNDWTLSNINSDDFMSYTEVTDKIEMILDIVNTRQFDVSADIEITNSNNEKTTINADLTADVENEINLHALAQIVSKDTTDVMLAYQNEYLFVNYDGLKLAIDKQNLKEILGIVLGVLGIDGSILGIVTDDMTLDMSNLQEIIPQVDMGNPLNMLTYLSGLEISKDNISIVVKESIFDSASDNEFRISINFENGRISGLSINNLHANGNVVDASLLLNTFSAVTPVSDSNTFIDISGSADLIRAFVNTSALDDFNVSGTVKVSGSIFGADIVNKVVNLDANIKLIDKKPVAAVAITNIPVIPIVNKDIPSLATSRDDRALYVYYRDDYFYLYRHETYFYWRDVTYEKKLKLTTEEFFSDPLEYLLGWGLGFADMIMDEIKKSIEVSSNRPEPINMANVLMGYTPPNGDGIHTLTINLGEIAYNNMLKNADIDLTTTKIEEKDYIHKMMFNMDIALTENIRIQLVTDNLTLNNIGNPVDISSAIQYINTYTYGANQQYEAKNGDWKKSSEVTYTISFDSNGSDETASPITGLEGTVVNLPTLKNYTIDNVNVISTYYEFLGWYTEKECINEFSENKIPRGDIVLFAKWGKTETYYRTIRFESNGGKTFDSITALAGSRFTLPTMTIKQITEGYSTSTYTFLGWYLDENYQTVATNIVPDFDATLYAKWSEPTVETMYKVIVFDNGVELGSVYVKPGTQIEFTDIANIDNTTKFYLDKDYKNEVTDFTMPDHEYSLHIRNYYNVKIESLYGNIPGINRKYLQGSVFTIPSQSNYYLDDGTQTKRVYYNFKYYTVNGVVSNCVGTYISPNADVEIIAVWEVVTKYYYTVTLNTKTTGLSNTADKGVTIYNSFKVLEGEIVDLSGYQPTCVYKWGIWYHCDFKYWQIDGNKVENNKFTMPSNNVEVKAKWGTPLGGKG